MAAYTQKPEVILYGVKGKAENIKPRDSDIVITRKFKRIVELHESPVLDHLILTRDSYFSFADENRLDGTGENVLKNLEEDFVGRVEKDLIEKVKHSKPTIEKL